jgi:hypothetical protein
MSKSEQTPNPYQSPQAQSSDQNLVGSHRSNAAGSIFMFVAGLVLFALSVCPVFIAGIDWFLVPHPYVWHLPFVVVAFFVFATGFTSLFHLTYLLNGWPKQQFVGLFAIGTAIVADGCALAVLVSLT